MPFESGHDYDGYVYGAPQQHGGDMGGVRPYQSQAPQVSAPGDMGCGGCLATMFIAPILLFMGVLDWRKAQLHAQTEQYHADRRLDAVVAQVTARLEDTREHLRYGIAPGLTVHDMDRTSLGASPADRPHMPTVNAGGAPVRRVDPFTINLPPTNYTYKGDTDATD